MNDSSLYSKFRAGFARTVADQLKDDDRVQDDPFLAGLLVRCWIALGHFGQAKTSADELASRPLMHDDDRLVVAAYGQLAAVMYSPVSTNRERLRQLCVELQQHDHPQFKAVGCTCEGRLIAIEIAVQLRPLTDHADATSRMESAITFYRQAGMAAEARDETAALADLIRKAPLSDSEPATQLLLGTLAEAMDCDDAVSQAKVQLMLAEIDLERALKQNNQDALAILQARFAMVSQLHATAEINGLDTAVMDAVGRLLLRFNISDGAALLSEAAQRWNDIGRSGWADTAWTELSSWHMHRGEMDQVVAYQEKRRENTSLQSTMMEVTDALTDAFGASNLGDFATVSTVLEPAAAKAASPGQEVGILLQQARALEASGKVAEATQHAERAVDLLRPAAPCVMLSEALFHLGMYQTDSDKAQQLFTDAAEAAQECGLTADAARHWMNLGQALQMPIGWQKLRPDTETAVDCFAKSQRLLEGELNRESIVLQGNLAQRRGQVAFWNRDFKTVGDEYSKAEQYFRLAEQNVDLAFILTQQALVLFDAARQNSSCDSWQNVVDRFDEASERFEKQGLRAESARLGYLSGSATFESHRLYPSEGQRLEKLTEALNRLENAALAMETLRNGRQELNLLSSTSSLEEFAMSQIKVYEQGLRICAGFLKNTDHAFLWLERMKSRAALDGLARTHFTAPTDFDHELTTHECDLEAQRQQLPKEDPTTPTRWLSLSHSLDEVWAKMEDVPELSSYGRIRRGRPVKWNDWRTALERESNRPEAGGRRFLTVHFHWAHPQTAHQTISVIGCRPDWKTPKLVEVDVDPDFLARFARMCFEAPAGGPSPLRTMLPDMGGDSAWQSRFSELITPVADWCDEGDIVGLFPHGPLHGLPLSTLLIEGQPLGERNAVFYSPSASIQHLVWRRESFRVAPDEAVAAAVFGCSLASGNFLKLPRACEEASFVSQLPALQVVPVLDGDVSRKNVINALPGADLVHFVGHGFESSDGWSSGLQLANDEKITALEFHDLRMRADLVTLSGCRTGCNRWRPGDEMVGLVPAVLQAGASSVFASIWEVNERPTELLMQHFYTQAYGSQRVSKADALRLAIRSVRAEFNDLVDWGAFHLYGDWR